MRCIVHCGSTAIPANLVSTLGYEELLEFKREEVEEGKEIAKREARRPYLCIQHTQIYIY